MSAESLFGHALWRWQDLLDSMPTPGTGGARIYHVPCTNAFRDDVRAMARRRGTTVAGLVRAGLAIAEPEGHPDVPDPGTGTVETIVMVCRDGRSRRFRRQAYLNIRLPIGLEETRIRRMLALVLMVGNPKATRLMTTAQLDAERLASQGVARLQQAIGDLAFQPLRDGVRSPRQAAYVLGMLSDLALDRAAVTRRFRTLAPLYHPDTGVLPDAERLRLLVDARNLLLARTG